MKKGARRFREIPKTRSYTEYWIEPPKRVAGLIMTQMLLYAGTLTLKLHGQCECSLYEALKWV